MPVTQWTLTAARTVVTLVLLVCVVTPVGGAASAEAWHRVRGMAGLSEGVCGQTGSVEKSSELSPRPRAQDAWGLRGCQMRGMAGRGVGFARARGARVTPAGHVHGAAHTWWAKAEGPRAASPSPHLPLTLNHAENLGFYCCVTI